MSPFAVCSKVSVSTKYVVVTIIAAVSNKESRNKWSHYEININVIIMLLLEFLLNNLQSTGYW